jgi:hypothetical protein
MSNSRLLIMIVRVLEFGRLVVELSWIRLLSLAVSEVGVPPGVTRSRIGFGSSTLVVSLGGA